MVEGGVLRERMSFARRGISGLRGPGEGGRSAEGEGSMVMVRGGMLRYAAVQ